MRSSHRRLSLLAASLLLAALAHPVAGQVPARPDLRERFQQADRNRDGMLDREEFHLAVVEAFYARDRQRKGHLLREEMENVSAEVFRTADKDGDGKLSLQEVLNARFIDFERADVNRNGVLTFEEVDVYTRSAR